MFALSKGIEARANPILCDRKGRQSPFFLRKDAGAVPQGKYHKRTNGEKKTRAIITEIDRHDIYSFYDIVI
jgi:hypothetical protein